MKAVQLFFFFIAIGSIKPIYGEPYLQNPYVDSEVWNNLVQYFLPEEHPIKPILDEIFSQVRVVESLESMQAAGFKLTETQGTRVYAMKHPGIPGYIFKMYPDNKPTRIDYVSWSNRIIGAGLLRDQIHELGHGSMFKVAHKWIYPLPAEPSPPEHLMNQRKNFVLIVDNMHILKKKENHRKWRSLKKKKYLRALYAIIRPVGAGDCVRANNLPWSRDGKIAFVDTEIHHRWPIRYHPLVEHLNESMRKFWLKLTEDGAYPE